MQLTILLNHQCSSETGANCDYSADDVYNVDETRIYSCAISNSTHALKNEIVSGSKMCKHRVTALVCANMIGGEETSNHWQEQRP